MKSIEILRSTRRQILSSGIAGLGSAALSVLLGPTTRAFGALSGLPHFPPKAQRVIFLSQSGAPSQLELFDFKPDLQRLDGQELPDSVHGGQRRAQTADQTTLPIAAPRVSFSQHGPSGAWISELFPQTASVAEELCIIKSMFTEAINHDPAITFLLTGQELPGRPSMGSWISYGLGAIRDELPTFVVLASRTYNPIAQPLYARLWGNGFLPSVHQGVQFRSSAEAVLFLRDGASPSNPERLRNAIAALERMHMAKTEDPEIETRIDASELAYRLQISVPQVTDLSDEPNSTFDLYGPEARIPGTHAANCLLARRLAERGVRFIQLFHRDWDHHYNLPNSIRGLAAEADRPAAALLKDLRQRGLLDDTLVIWGGEFGRTVYSQGPITADSFGRDHHPRCFSIWMAGGGVKRGLVHGETDEFSYNVVRDPVHVHDLQATILHLLGIDHLRLTYRYLGRDIRLTDVGGRVVSEIIA